jgi:alpha-beta hydrolase superfamily lysophospholipase
LNQRGPAIQAPALLDTQIMLADGAALPVRRWLPDDAPRAVIVALHGFNDYSRAFEQPATYWASRGIATYAFDQRGFGNAPNRGIWAGHDTMVADAAAAIGLIRTRHPGRPVFVAGESMGGAIAMIAASQGMLKADGLILVAPALRGRPYLGVIPRAMLWLGAQVIPVVPPDRSGAAHPGIRQYSSAASPRRRSANYQGNPGRCDQGAGRYDGCRDRLGG